jgi:hypothetical protein
MENNTVPTPRRRRSAANTKTESATLHVRHFPPPPMTLAVKRLLIDTFTADALRQLAWLMDQEEPRTAARRNLSPEGIEELADIITNRHSVPTVGFFRRNRREDAAS